MNNKRQSWGMGVSKKLAVSASLALFLSGCGSLWPNDEVTEAPAPSSPVVQKVATPSNLPAPAPAEPVAVAPQPVVQASAPARAVEQAAPTSAGDNVPITFVGNKVDEMSGDLEKLQGQVAALQDRLGSIQVDSERSSDDYHAFLGTITARLQRGST
ncbi:MAG: hypothetical protein R3261_05770, partial [Alphaproteobacteria bacterium]|nr:hypothetical protein [Alphaproteobacteria bacterium]